MKDYYWAKLILMVSLCVILYVLFSERQVAKNTGLCLQLWNIEKKLTQWLVICLLELKFVNIRD